MTEVLSITQPDANTHFGSPLRRSSPQSSFLLQHVPSYSRSSPNLKSRYAAVGYDTSKLPSSLPSSAPSSPRLNAPDFSAQPSCTSTPSSSLSLDEQCYTEEDEGIQFPSYDDGGYFNEIEEPPSSPVTPEPDAVRQSTSDTSLADRAYTEPAQHQPIAGDDTTIESEPTTHVDYLSHNWKEEDIWSSWRHVVAKRDVYSNGPRLENAAWRTWAKCKYRLRTVSPETLNWMKDHDVTWLYGPLQTGKARLIDFYHTPPTGQVLRSNSFATKKPILKKRTLSEIMLQKSLSTSTLMKQATDALRAQPPRQRRPNLGDRTPSDYATSSDLSISLTRSTTEPSTDASTTTSGMQTPCSKRHIHFNNKVEQCIAIDKDIPCGPHCFSAIRDDEDSSEDEMLLMKPVANATKATIGSSQSTPRNSFSSDSKTIAMLPSTTLNCRGDTPSPGQQQSKKKAWRGGAKLSPSPSQQTLKPSSSFANFLLDDDDEDADIDWQPSAANNKRDSLFPRGGLQIMPDDEDEDTESLGLRRTPSGMFMPYEDVDDSADTGILSRVLDTVNTAKDIAHVIWNVGWHR